MEDDERALLGTHEAHRKHYSWLGICALGSRRYGNFFRARMGHPPPQSKVSWRGENLSFLDGVKSVSWMHPRVVDCGSGLTLTRHSCRPVQWD